MSDPVSPLARLLDWTRLIHLSWLCGAGCVWAGFWRLRVAFPLPSHFRAFHNRSFVGLKNNARQRPPPCSRPFPRARFAAKQASSSFSFVQSVEMSNEAEQNIQTWKIKKLIKSLDAARGCVLPSHSRSTSRNIGLTSASLLQCWHFDDQPHHSAQGELVTGGSIRQAG
jgi:hypothetical protein